MPDAPTIELERVHRSFQRGEHRIRVLEDVSLSVWPGRIGAVYGGREQGKTTLLEIAAGLRAIERGNVRVCGDDLMCLSGRALDRFRSQDVCLAERQGPRFDVTVEQQLRLSAAIGHKWRKAERLERVASMLERFELIDCAKVPLSALSRFERTRAELAQASVRDPRLLLVDDLLGGSSLGEAIWTFDVLEDLVRETGCAVLIAAGDQQSVIRASSVWHLHHGRLRVMYDDPTG
jgi:putative ABC transport system ATP-binding protein